MTEKTSKIIELFNVDTTKFALAKTGNLVTPFDITPQDFIKYAEVDLQSNYEHSIVNALSNSKRALDCQLDSLLYLLGYYNISQKNFWSFPKKLDLINELGIIAPRVLRKINKQRNLLEHQFVRPEKVTVEDFLDIAMLFIASTDRYTLKFTDQLHLKNDELGKIFVIEILYKESLIEISEIASEDFAPIEREERKHKSIQVYSYSVNNDDYKFVLQDYLKRIK